MIAQCSNQEAEVSTPLALVRKLRSSFPEFTEVRVVRDGPGALIVYCAIVTEAQRIEDLQLSAWKTNHVSFPTSVRIEQVLSMPYGLDDEEALLQRTTIQRSVVEDALTNVDMLSKLLVSHFLGEVNDVRASAGTITICVDPSLSSNREQEILDTARLLLPSDPVSLTFDRSQRPISDGFTAESASTLRRLAEDIALINDNARGILAEEFIELPPLPPGASTYASPHDGVTNLQSRIALFERVYVYMPFSREDFPQWVGASFSEFLDVLPTGRVIPVFGQSVDRYETGLTSQVLESGAPRVVLRGENALRALRTLRDDLPMFSLIQNEQAQQMRALLEEETTDEARYARELFDVFSQMAAELPSIAISGLTISMAVTPYADWLDNEYRAFGYPSRDLEMIGALEHRAVTRALGDGAPMSAAGHYFDSCLRWVYGAAPGQGRILKVPDPTIIGRIAFPDTHGLSLREFAQNFTGPPVSAMRELMLSQRVQEADGTVDLVAEFNRELKQFSRRGKDGYIAFGILLNVIGTFALGPAFTLAGFGVELTKQILARKNPTAFATIAAKLTRSTREAALLAQIRAHSS